MKLACASISSSIEMRYFWKEATCSFSPGRELGANSKTERSGERLAGSCGGFTVVGGLKELGTDRLDNVRLAQLDINVHEAIVLQKLLALESYIDSAIVGERSRATPWVATPNANPEYDISRGLPDVADPNDFGTRPVHIFLIQDGVNLEGYIVLPNLQDLMVSWDLELFELGLLFGAERLLP